MKILALIFVLIGYTFQGYSQTKDKYKVKLRKDNNKELIIYDTIVNLDYLLQKTKKYNGISNFEFFQEFNYETLKCKNQGDKKLTIFNDTIEITITTKLFDTIQFKKNLALNSNYYINHQFYGLDETKLSKDTHSLPYSEISMISIKINNKLKKLPLNEYPHFYNPNIICSKDNYPTKGYLTDKGEIIIQMDNSDGAGFYYAIFVFDRHGNLKRKIVKRMI